MDNFHERTLLITHCSLRGGRPATPNSRPNHIFLIFSSEPPRPILDTLKTY